MPRVTTYHMPTIAGVVITVHVMVLVILGRRLLMLVATDVMRSPGQEL